MFACFSIIDICFHGTDKYWLSMIPSIKEGIYKPHANSEEKPVHTWKRFITQRTFIANGTEPVLLCNK